MVCVRPVALGGLNSAEKMLGINSLYCFGIDMPAQQMGGAMAEAPPIIWRGK